ncbi:MAG: YraN family protein [Pseudomonadota bacterium]
MTPTAETSRRRRALRGATAHRSGLAAETDVARHYALRGHDLAEERWRGQSGEIDLIMRDGDGLVFVEVKRARSLHAAAHRLGPRQLRRLFAAGEEYLATEHFGLDTPVRFDLALVGAAGELEVIENITLH